MVLHFIALIMRLINFIMQFLSLAPNICLKNTGATKTSHRKLFTKDSIFPIH